MKNWINFQVCNKISMKGNINPKLKKSRDTKRVRNWYKRSELKNPSGHKFKHQNLQCASKKIQPVTNSPICQVSNEHPVKAMTFYNGRQTVIG